MNWKKKVLGQFALLFLIAVAVAFIHPKKAFAAPFCSYEDDFYSDANFTNMVGWYGTPNCSHFQHSGTTTTNFYIHYDDGDCGTDVGPGDCTGGANDCSCPPIGSYECVNGVCQH